jgi:hypothetical protein
MAEPGKTPKKEDQPGSTSEELSQEELDQLAGGKGHHPHGPKHPKHPGHPDNEALERGHGHHGRK